ncbi:GntR family transcriptional regulator [Thermoflexibacter ruber]|uniref:GntR family transcriptional regulator n=1 Tax=Thermoflexibacter ruber TaxID=1003 RepID=A0A1I2JMU0_9BACT|nr:GntR family transcriptional regulator [Thermoflexibacter ruber]SFF55904.1 GntR family transcriptional regulator [Thermoflexibacter ruber]
MEKNFIYTLIYQDLKREIQEGKYKAGSLLPSENDLCKTYQTTRVTVRHALDKLLQEELIYKEKGKGSFIKAQIRSLGLLSFKGFSEVVGKAYSIKTQILQPLSIQSFPPNFLYELSQKEKESKCIFLERLRFVDDEPVMLEKTYLPNIISEKPLENIIKEPLLEDSLFKTLQNKFQIEVTGVEQAIKAILSNRLYSELLKLTFKSPMLYIQRRYTTNIKDFYIYSLLYCNTSKYAISNTF